MHNPLPQPYYALDAIIEDLANQLEKYKATPYSKGHKAKKKQELIDKLCLIQHTVSPMINYDLCCALNQIIENTKERDKKQFVVELTREDIRHLLRSELSTFLKEGLKLGVEFKQEDELLTVEQTCKFLHFAKPTIYSYVSQRKIPFIKKGRRLLFSKTKLKEWLKESYMKTDKELKADTEVNILNKEGGRHAK
jgi:excisionase family DNA binding protein